MATELPRAQPQSEELKLQGDKIGSAVPGGSTRSAGNGGGSIKQFMTTSPECIESSQSLFAAAQKMKQINAGLLPVCEGSHDNIIGVVTDRDLVIRGLAENKDPKSLTVKDVLSRDVQRIREDESLDSAKKLLQEKQLRRLLVFSKDNKLTGILSVADLPGGAQWGGGSISQQSQLSA